MTEQNEYVEKTTCLASGKEYPRDNQPSSRYDDYDGYVTVCHACRKAIADATRLRGLISDWAAELMFQDKWPMYEIYDQMIAELGEDWWKERCENDANL